MRQVPGSFDCGAGGDDYEARQQGKEATVKIRPDRSERNQNPDAGRQLGSIHLDDPKGNHQKERDISGRPDPDVFQAQVPHRGKRCFNIDS